MSLWARALLGALGVGALLGAVANPRPGGDYACFYAAGRLVLTGGSPYDEAALRALEAPWIASGWLPFPYPPATAVLQALLAWLPYRAAYAADVALMLLALLAVPVVLRPVLPTATRSVSVGAALCLGWPMVRALLGGQGTPLWLLLVAGAARLLHDRRPLAAGAVAGALLLKPTLGLPLVALTVLAGGPWALAGASASAVALWGVSAAVQGPGWVATWWEVAWRFQAGAQRVEGAGNVGLLGAAEHLLGYGGAAVWAAGGAAAAAVATGLAVAWRRASWPVRLGLAGAWLPLLPPHAVWYDAGLAGLAALALLESEGAGRAGWLAVGAAHVLLLAPLLAPVLGWQPLVPALILVGIAVAVTGERRRGV